MRLPCRRTPLLALRRLCAVLACAAPACSGAVPATPPPSTASLGAAGSRPTPLDLSLVRATFRRTPSPFDSPFFQATARRVELGRRLYFDPRIAGPQDLACGSCHRLDRGGAAGDRLSTGHAGIGANPTGAETLWNAAGQIGQLHDGRGPTPSQRSRLGALDPRPMPRPDPLEVERALRSIASYEPELRAAFPEDNDPVSWRNVARAIGAFERALTPPTWFDVLLDGRDDALDPAEKEGLALFMASGCADCHNGPLLGGTFYLPTAAAAPPSPSPSTPGAGPRTGPPPVASFIKVPSLRNVIGRAPYYRDGSMADLPSALRAMSRVAGSGEFSDEQVASITRFLATLETAPPADAAPPDTGRAPHTGGTP